MNSDNSGLFGILAIGGLVAAFFILRRFLPSLATILLWAAIILIVIVIVLIVLVIVFSVKGAKQQNDPNAPSAVMAKARSELMELRRMQLKIKDRGISSRCGEIIAIVDRILSTLRSKPEATANASEFLNSYLPTLAKILTSYTALETSGSVSDELKETTAEHLSKIRAAMEKQYDSLFEDEKLDMTVDMEALTLALKRDGLITDDEDKK